MLNTKTRVAVATNQLGSHSCVYSYSLRRRVTSATINKRTIAPMTDAISVPKVPTGNQPISPTSHPPRKPPTIPTIRLMINPDPLPLTTRFASQPATSPISRYHKKYIAQVFSVVSNGCKMCAKIISRSVKLLSGRGKKDTLYI